MNLQQFAQAAGGIANPNSITDVSDIVDLKQAQNAIELNAAVLMVANEMSDELIDTVV